MLEFYGYTQTDQSEPEFLKHRSIPGRDIQTFEDDESHAIDTETNEIFYNASFNLEACHKKINTRFIRNSLQNSSSKEKQKAFDLISESTNHEYDYSEVRRNAYPEICEQLDMIYHDIDSWKASIQAIKEKYPKS